MFYQFCDDRRRRDELINILHSETRRVITLRREYLRSMKINRVEDADQETMGIKKRLGFLDILLLAQSDGADLSDSDIQEEVDTFMFAGHDTISSAITFVLYCLSTNADVQRRAYEESVLLEGQEDETMQYLEAVIKESLRLFPSVPSLSRKVTEEITIGNLKMPLGSVVSVPIYHVHRNNEIFPEPEVFKPERFLSNIDYHPFAVIPFSAGPRNCIGQRFAKLELKYTVSRLLRAFEFLPVDDFKPILLQTLVLKSENGIQVKLKRRNS